jgi:hypothetical protein
MVPCGCRQNGAFASALAGIVPEKLANVAVTTNAEPKPASFCIERLPGFSSQACCRTEFSSGTFGNLDHLWSSLKEE